MSSSRDRFVREGIPVGEFFKEVANQFYWAYEFNRNQWQEIEGSPAEDSEIDINEGNIWGLEMTEVTDSLPENSIGRLEDHVLYAVVEQALRNRGRLMTYLRDRSDGEEECAEAAFRNLSNAWRDEYALNQPFDFDAEDRMKTAEWRISKCYYSLYKSLSAIEHTKLGSRLEGSHTKVLNIHETRFIRSKVGDLYVFPFNFYDITSSKKHTTTYPVPYPIDDSAGIDEGEIISRYNETLDYIFKRFDEKIDDIENGASPSTIRSFYHVMKFFREWANYEHGGIFSRLYGEGYRKYMDTALRLMSFTAMTISEVALIASFGFDKYRSELELYEEASKVGIQRSSKLPSERCEVYRRALDEF